MNQTTAVLNRWTNEGQKTDVPKATYGDPWATAVSATVGLRTAVTCV